MIAFAIFELLILKVLSEATNCEEMSAKVALEDSVTMVDTSLKMLAGTWASEECETRPGSQHVLRYYTFEDDGNYFFIQHYYWDDSCSLPQFSVYSYGNIQLRNSMIQPGAAAGTLNVFNITVIPQDDNAARELDRRASDECPNLPFKSWRKYEEHTVYESRFSSNLKFKLWLSSSKTNRPFSINSNGNNVQVSDISCLGSLMWAFNELKLLKIQLRPSVDGAKRVSKEVKIELLLGDIHTNEPMRKYHNPSGFQVPLLKVVKEPTEILINRHAYTVKNAQILPQNIYFNSYTPPHLIEKPPLPPYIWGYWVSSRCESQSKGKLYLLRKFSFHSDDNYWVGEYNFFLDPFCKIPKFTVSAFGNFQLRGINRQLRRSSNIDFQIDQATLTVEDQKMANDMQLARRCGLEPWKVNQPQDLSETGGCVQLGIVIPSIRYDIVKVEIDYKGSCLLFLGQVDTDGEHSNDENDRPTSFQLPLVKCGDVPEYSKKLWNIFSENAYGFSRGSKTAVLNDYYLIVSVIVYLIIIR